METKFERVRVIINPASGSDEPMLNIINDVFAEGGIQWDARITHEHGDGERLTAEAIAEGADLIVSYGGDGTVNEVANALIGHDIPLAILPGGTGNGVGTDIGVPLGLRNALQLITGRSARRRIDAGKLGDRYFLLRAIVGLPEVYNPSRDEKNRLGLLAYPLNAIRLLKERPPSHFCITVDDYVFDEDAIVCLVNNVGYSGAQRLSQLAERLFLDVKSHLGGEVIEPEQPVLQTIGPTDGLLDVILLTQDPLTLRSLSSLLIRNAESQATVHLFQGRRITIESTPPLPVNMDGEDGWATPGQFEIIPGAIEVLVPETKAPAAAA